MPVQNVQNQDLQETVTFSHTYHYMSVERILPPLQVITAWIDIESKS